MAYATVEDIEARLGRELTDAEEARAEALLTDASALVESFTNRRFGRLDGDTVTLRADGVWLRLPSPPVHAVHSVTAVGGSIGLPDLPLALWAFDGVDKIDVAGAFSDQIVNLPSGWRRAGYGTTLTYRVVYDHGFDEIPEDIRYVVCSMVIRTLTSPAGVVDGLVSENIGQYSYQMQQGQGSAGASVRLTRADEGVLRRYRRRASTIHIRGW